MPSYKLLYFNIMGLGDSIRYMLSYLGEDFEDNRIYDYHNEWLTVHKPKMPFGKLPLLEIDGKKAHQTIAICRYLGKKAKLVGDNEWEDLEIDMIIDTLSDLRQAIWSYFYNKDEENRKRLRDPLFNKTLPLYLGKFDNIIKENGFLANGKLSWGDIYFVSVLGYFSFMIEQDICAKYPHINELSNKICAIPNIKKWLEKRPQTQWSNYKQKEQKVVQELQSSL